MLTRKIQKIAIVSATICVVLLITVWSLFGVWAKPYVESYLLDLQNKNKQGKYLLQYEDLKISWWKGSIRIHDFQLIPKDSSQVADIFRLNSDAELTSVDWSALFWQGRLKINSITFQHPEIYWQRGSKQKLASETPKDATLEVRKALKEVFRWLDGLYIEKINLEKGELTGYPRVDQRTKIHLEALDIHIQSIRLDSNLIDHPWKGVHFDSLYLNTGKLMLKSSLQTLSYQNLAIQTEKKGNEEASSEFNLLIKQVDWQQKNHPKDSIASQHFRLEALTLNRWNWSALLNENALLLDAILIERPQFDYLIPTSSKKQAKNNTLNLQIPAWLDSLYCEQIRIRGGKASLSKEINQPFLDLADITLDLENIGLHEQGEASSNMIPLRFETARLGGKRVTCQVSEFYEARVDSFLLDLKNSYFYCQRPILKPLYTRRGFNQRLPYEQDWFSIKTNQLEVKGWDWKAWLEQQAIRVQSVEIAGLYLDVYRDKWQADEPFRYKKMPAALIREIPIPITVNKILAQAPRIRYQQLGDLVQTGQPGEISFEQAKIDISNFSNEPSVLAQRPELKVQMTSRFMGAGLFDLHIDIPLNRYEDTFRSYGQLNRIPGSRLNPMLYGLTATKIIEGDIQKARFEMNANEEMIQGTLHLDYEALKVEMYDPEKHGKVKGLMSFLANTVIREHNLPDTRRYKVGTIQAPRRKDRFIFNYIWQGLKSGVIDVMLIFAPKQRNQ